MLLLSLRLHQKTNTETTAILLTDLKGRKMKSHNSCSPREQILVGKHKTCTHIITI